MKKRALLALALALALTACGKGNESKPQEDPSAETEVAVTEAAEIQADASTVEITDIHGTVTVPVNPQKVVALDNRTFETLEDWGIEVVAVPKQVMSTDSAYYKDENVVDIGNHREPDLEALAAADPDLVIIGQRFASHYEDIKALVPNAAVIDLTWDVSEEAATPGENLVAGLRSSTESLGKIFGKEAEAEALNKSFDDAISGVKEAYNPEQKVMTIIVNGGEIRFAAPKSGRVWGPLYEVFGWTPALDIDDASSDHKGDDISVEAIAQSNPDWILVLDRDAAVSAEGEFTPAADVIAGSEALKNVKAVQEGKMVFAPNDTYVNESIQTYLELFENLAESFKK